jgi:hypothetical protein
VKKEHPIFLPKDIELQASKICEKLGARLVQTTENSRSHQIEVFWGDKSEFDYLYIDRKRGFNTKHHNIQVVIHPKVNSTLAEKLIIIDGVSSPENTDKGKLIDSSQYKGFKNRKVNGEYVGAAWRLALDNDLVVFEKFLSVLVGKIFVTEQLIQEPDDVDSEKYVEGTTFDITLTKYERSKAARNECIKFYGTKCLCCGFDFEKTYGLIGKGFIHIHHIVPVAEIGESYSVDPVKDLIPLCANCHAMVHKKTPPFTLFEIQSRIPKNL